MLGPKLTILLRQPFHLRLQHGGLFTKGDGFVFELYDLLLVVPMLLLHCAFTAVELDLAISGWRGACSTDLNVLVVDRCLILASICVEVLLVVVDAHTAEVRRATATSAFLNTTKATLNDDLEVLLRVLI